jgi:hypothetical protein
MVLLAKPCPEGCGHLLVLASQAVYLPQFADCIGVCMHLHPGNLTTGTGQERRIAVITWRQTLQGGKRDFMACTQRFALYPL